MPRKPKKPCAYSGCPNLTDETYCREHKRKAAKRYDRYERSADVNKRYGRGWRKIRKKYISSHPYCEICFSEGRLRFVEEVHHIVPLSAGGSNREENLMSLCRSCHNRIHLKMGDRRIPT